MTEEEVRRIVREEIEAATLDDAILSKCMQNMILASLLSKKWDDPSKAA